MNEYEFIILGWMLWDFAIADVIAFERDELWMDA